MARICILVVCISFLSGLNGCSQNQKQDSETLASNSNSKLHISCFSYFYKSPDTTYVTNQTHFFNSKNQSLQMVSTEPEGLITWSLNNTILSVHGKTVNSDTKTRYNAPIATAIYYSMMSAIGEVDLSKIEPAEPAKVEGQWYRAYEINKASTDITLLENQNSSQVDLLTVKTEGHTYLARSYNLRFDKDRHQAIPRTIDIYDISEGFASKKLILQIQYNKVETIQ